MSFAACACPPAATVGAINILNCPADWGQIQKMIIGRRQASFMIDTLAHAAVLANWTTILTAVDATKVQCTPFFENMVIPPGGALTEGGDDNSTLDGLPQVVGTKAIAVNTARYRSLPAATLLQLKAYNCESDLWVAFINEFGKIIASSSNGTLFQGFPINSYFIGDTGSEGKNKNNMTPFQFNLRYGWADKVVFITPSDFDARFALNS